MIEKVKVRQKIASYELKIKEEIKKAEKEINKYDEECSVSNMVQKFWYDSKERAVLCERLKTLREALFILTDLRCDDLLND